ncbi:MAG: PAS domain S-box protein [Deltaproteobacteria bacterium]|nr:PAS domain S-box protein [Deltaproteobacteria bacterium]
MAPLRDPTEVEGEKLATARVARAEVELTLSDARCRSLVELSPDAIFINRGDKVAFVNSAALGLFRAQQVEQLVGRPIWDLFHPDVHPVIRERLRHVRAGEPVPRIEEKILRLDGEMCDVEVVASQFADREGQAVQVILRDITERKLAEAALQRAQIEASRRAAELDAVIDSMADGVLVIDAAGRVVRSNPAFSRTFGVPVDWLERPLADRIRGLQIEHEDGVPVRPEDTPGQRALRGETVRGVSQTKSRADGVVLHLSTSSAPIHGKDGIVGAVVSFADVTEHRRAQEALRRAHDNLEATVQARTAEVTAVNRTLRMISACNEAVVRATDELTLATEICKTVRDLGGYLMVWVGYAEDDEHKTVRPVAAIGFEDGYLEQAKITWADRERGRGPTGTCIRTGAPRVCHDFCVDAALAPWRQDAERRGYRSSVALPLKAGGKVLGALSIYADRPHAFGTSQVTLLTELADDLAFGILALRAQGERDQALRLAEERTAQLRALAVELGATEHRERERLAKVLHDHLQQLLVGAKLGIAAIEDKLRSRAQRTTIQRVVGVLDEAIQASRSLTAELSPPALHAKGLGAGLEWLAGRMRDKHGLEVTVQADADAEPGVEALRLVLFEATRELLFNVVKHAGVRRAAVTLARGPQDRLLLTVADDGAGFDVGALDVGPASGAGFGLFHIRERLSHFGGALQIDSAPGRGSRFTLMTSLALATTVEPVLAPAASLAVPRVVQRPQAGGAPRGYQAGDRIRILIADDHPVMREGLARVFAEQLDMEVVGEAGDGLETLELCGTLRPDVVVMDVGMPHASGVDVTRIIRAELPGVRVVGLSMHDEADMAVAMRKAGAVAYLTKDGPIDAVIEAVRGAVHKAEGGGGKARRRRPAQIAGRQRKKRGRPGRGGTRRGFRRVGAE